MNLASNKARAALVKWSRNTAPEQFIAEHTGIIFPTRDRDVRIVSIDVSEQIRKYYRKFGGITTHESHKR